MGSDTLIYRELKLVELHDPKRRRRRRRGSSSNSQAGEMALQVKALPSPMT